MRKDLKWTEDKVAVLREKREAGITLEEISKQYGVSKQRISQVISGKKKSYYRKKTRQLSVYPGLDRWMLEKGITYVYLNELMGFSKNSWQAIRKRVRGESKLRKEDIDKLIRLSHMSYEELFGEVQDAKVESA